MGGRGANCAFAFGAFRDGHPGMFALNDRVRDRSNVATFLASDRRTPFNELGIFRHYPELDALG